MKEMMFCQNCGSAVQDDARFCPSCGHLITKASIPTSSTQPAKAPSSGQSPPTNYANLFDRGVAMIVDLIIVGVASAVISIPFGVVALVGDLFHSPVAAALSSGFFTAIGILGWLAYYTYFESKSGQTPGKSVMRIRVVDERTGGSIDLGKALIRSALRFLDFLPFLYILGAFVAWFTPKRQRIGDMAAGTIVIKE